MVGRHASGAVKLNRQPASGKPPLIPQGGAGDRVSIHIPPWFVTTWTQLTIVNQDVQRDVLHLELVDELPDGCHGSQVAIQELHWRTTERPPVTAQPAPEAHFHTDWHLSR